MSTRFKDPFVWLYGLMSGFISGGAGAAGAAFGTMFVDPKTFNMENPGKLLSVMGWTFLFAGLSGVIARLQKSPLPEIEEFETVVTTTNSKVTETKTIVPLIAIAACLAGIVGCSSTPKPAPTPTPGPTNQLERRIENLAFIGTTAYLSQKNVDRAAVQTVYDALLLLEGTSNFNPTIFSATGKKNAQLYAAVIEVLLEELAANGINMQTPPQVQQFLSPIRRGIGKGLEATKPQPEK